MTTAKDKAAFEARMKQLEDELQTQRELTEQYRQELESDREDGDEDFSESEATLLYDPFDSQNPFKVIGHVPPDDEYPEGAVVSWKSPTYRARRQWRGWIPFEYGDKYTGKKGEKLSEYIPDPPPVLQGTAELDNYVRRGDVVLARLDKRIYDSRQAKRILDSQKQRGHAGSRAKTVLGDGVEIVGRGLAKSQRPRGGFRPEQESAPMAPGAHRTSHPTSKSQES